VLERQMTVTIPRRKLITLLGSAVVAWPRAVGAQQKKLPRIGALVLGNADAELFRTELQEGLRSSSYIEGQNVLLEFRSAEGKLERLPGLAAELVALKVDVIVAVYTPCAFAAQRATREIPIVILAGNPVETGLVSSLARPGGNITGISLVAAELHGKCVELFRDMLPSVRRVAALSNLADPSMKLILDRVQLAGKATGIEIAPSLSVRGPDEIDAALAAMKNAEAGAVVIQGSLSTKIVAELALKYRLPAATVPRSFTEVGGLMSYSFAESEALRRSALFVIKILQGEKPADIPVEQPSKFELAINLKTAKALDLRIAEAFLLRAERVIE
jgi:putative ABC transport system substrate-binding protein